MVTTRLYGKKTLILKKITSTLLSNKLEKSQIKRSRKDWVWWSQEEKEEEKERKVWAHRRHVAFTRKVIEIISANIGKSD